MPRPLPSRWDLLGSVLLSDRESTALARSPLARRHGALWSRRASRLRIRWLMRAGPVIGGGVVLVILMLWHNQDPVGFRAALDRLGLGAAMVWVLRLIAAALVVAIAAAILPHRRWSNDQMPRYARWLRTHPFERALRRGSPGELADLASLWDAREAGWNRRAGRSFTLSDWGRYQSVDRLGSALMQLGCAWLILMVWIPRLIIENRTVLPSEASMLFWAPYLAAAVVSLTGLYRARRAGMTAIGERKCPDCGYNLRGSVPALAVDRIGPARCNECGARWPLVPPADPVAEG